MGKNKKGPKPSELDPEWYQRVWTEGTGDEWDWLGDLIGFATEQLPGKCHIAWRIYPHY